MQIAFIACDFSLNLAARRNSIMLEIGGVQIKGSLRTAGLAHVFQAQYNAR